MEKVYPAAEVHTKINSSQTYGWQLYALLYKNVVLFRRNWIASLLHLFAPSVCVLIFGIALMLNGRETMVLNPDLIDTFTVLPKCLVFDGVDGRFGYGVPIEKAACVALVYSPKSPAVTQIMQHLAKANNLVLERDILGFTNQTQLAQYLMATSSKPVHAGIVFNDSEVLIEKVPNPTSLEKENDTTNLLSYEIWFNRTVGGKFLSDAGQDMLHFFTKLEQSSILQVQRAVNEAIVSSHIGKEAKFTLRLKPFPYVSKKKQLGSSLLDKMGPAFYLIGIMISFIITLRQIVQEKDNKILDALRMMGLFESCYWLSWILYYSVITFFSAVLMLLAGKLTSVPEFVYANEAIKLATLYLFLLAMATFSMALSTVIPTTKVAVMVGFFLISVASIFQLFVCMQVFPLVSIIYDPYTMPSIARSALNLYPPLVFAKIENNIFGITKPREIEISPGNFTIVHDKYTYDDAYNGPYIYYDTVTATTINRSEPYITGCLNQTHSNHGKCYISSNDCEDEDAIFKYNSSTGESEIVQSKCLSKVCSNQWSESVSKKECEDGGYRYFETRNSGYLRTKCECGFELPTDASSLQILFNTIVFYLALAWYIGQICTYGHGRAEPPWFVINPAYWTSVWKKKKRNSKVKRGSQPSKEAESEKDEDVKKEEEAIQSCQRDDSTVYPVVIQSLVKDFGHFSKRFRAVDGITLSLKKGELFALLGHNGAGKTTAINILSGMVKSSGGDGYIYGKSIVDNMSTIRHSISVCPQFDILWNELSASEHLQFYGHFQGMTSHEISARGPTLLKQVHLDSVTKLAGNYSGGMKRRLSMTIAALGNKQVVFLDEPTTGLDPQNQRHVWNMINEIKKDKVVILTTHLMEEADALGDRIGIMSSGKLIALGNSLHLKRRFGGNYKIAFSPMSKELRKKVHDEVIQIIPSMVYPDNVVLGVNSMEYKIPEESFCKISQLLTWADIATENKVIRDWGISQTSLEDIFIKLAHKNEPVNENKSDVAKSINNEERKVGMNTPEDHNGTMNGFNQSSVNFRPSWQNQLSALLYKTITLHIRQKKSVFIQIAIPTLLILLMYWLQTLVDKHFSSDNPRDSSFLACSNCIAEVATNYRQGRETGSYNSIFEYLAKNSLNSTQSLSNLDVLAKRIDLGVRNKYYNNYEAVIKALPNEAPLWFKMSTNPFYAFCVEKKNGYSSCKSFHQVRNAGFILQNPSSFSSFMVEQSQSEIMSTTSQSDFFNGNVKVMVASSKQSVHKQLGEQCFNKTGILKEAINVSINSGLFKCSNGNCQLRNISNYVTLVKDLKLSYKSTKLNGNFLSKFPSRLVQSFVQNTRVEWGPKQSSSGTKYGDYSFSISPSLCSLRNYSAYNDLLNRKFSDEALMVDEIVYKNQLAVSQSVGKFGLPFKYDPAGYSKGKLLMDDSFPAAVLLFNDIDVQKGIVDVTLQSWYHPRQRCFYRGDYPYARIFLEYKSSTTESIDRGYNKYCFGTKDFSKIPVMKSIHQFESRILTGLTTAILRSQTGIKSSPLSGVVNVEVGIKARPFPYKSENADSRNLIKNEINIISSSTFLPLATTFVLPVLVFHIVHEKEHRLRAMMLMMGLDMNMYWLAQYCYDTIVTLCTFLIINIVGEAGKISIFVNHQFGIVLTLLILWSNTLTAFAFFLSTFFNRTRNANIFVYLMVLASAIMSLIVNVGFRESQPFAHAPGWWVWFPPFAYYRAIFLLSKRTYYWIDIGFFNDELGKLWFIMFVQSVVLFSYTMLIEVIIPKKYGIQSWSNIVKRIIFRRNNATSNDPCNQNDIEIGIESTDPDVVIEEKLVKSESTEIIDSPIWIKNLKKSFGDFVAVDGLYLHMKKNECFALLGPNGAGKTTTISILTGLFGPSSGTAYINSHSIETDLQKVHESIGVCPQHDVSWPELTVEEHFLFYARLKGVLRKDEKLVVKQAMLSVDLKQCAKKKSRQLSGGQRRRMSLGLSFIGNSSVVFLDEPTTGVDPATKTLIDMLILKEKKSRCIVLTTHLMDEAEKLSDNIGIMAHGKLKALGTSQNLKSKYSQGFKLVCIFSNDSLAIPFLEKAIPHAVLESRVTQKATFQIRKDSDMKMAQVFEILQENALSNGIENWGLRQTSLEEVFIQIAQQSESLYGTA